MNIRDFKYLVAVAEMQHFGKAAEKCFVSQPTLSMQLKKLEQELGVQVFERTNKQVLVTEQGKQVIEQAKQILQQVDQLKDLVKNFQDPFAGSFRLGIIPTLGPYLLPKILSPINQRYPNLDLIIFENKTDTILKALKEGALDAIILALPVPDEGLLTEELFVEPFYVALPKKHKLAKHKQIHVKDLDGESLLLLEEGHCLRDQTLDVCRLAHIDEREGFKATSLETLRHLVAADAGVTLLPELAIRYSQLNPLIAIRPFSSPQPVRKIAMLWREQSARQVCCSALAKLVGQILVSKVKE